MLETTKNYLKAGAVPQKAEYAYHSFFKSLLLICSPGFPVAWRKFPTDIIVDYMFIAREREGGRKGGRKGEIGRASCRERV